MVKLLIVVILLLCAGMVLWFNSPLGRSPDPVSVRSHIPAKSSGRSGTRGAQRQLGPEESAAAFRRLLKESEELGTSWFFHEFQQIIAGMALDDARKFARAWLADDESTYDHVEVLSLLLLRWATEEPREAWTAVRELQERNLLSEAELGAGRTAALYTEVMRGWARSDPAEALRMIEDSIEEWFSRVMIQSFEVHRLIFAEWTKRDPDAAAGAVMGLTHSARRHAAQGYLGSLPKGTDWRALADEIPALIGLEPEEDSAADRQSFVEGGGNLGRILGASEIAARKALAGSWLREDPTGALEWYVSEPGDVRPIDREESLRADKVYELLSDKVNPRAEPLLRWIEEQPWKWPHSDEIILAFLRHSAVYQRDIRPRLVAGIRSEEARFAVLKHMASNSSIDFAVPGIWESLLTAAELSPEREKLLGGIVQEKIKLAREAPAPAGFDSE